MNRQDVHMLQQARSFPALSILLPTHRTSPDNKQDPIRLKNLVGQATEQLLAQMSRREAKQLLDRLEKLIADIDFRYTLDGLALFVNADLARAFKLPFTLQERVVVSDSFATRDLVFALNRTPRYWVLALSEQATRLFEGEHDALLEITSDDFPMRHTGPGGDAPLPSGPGVNPSAHRDERHRQFFRQVDAAFRSFYAADPLPLVLVGVDRYLAFFREVSAHGQAVLTTYQGNADHLSAHDLGVSIWPAVKEALAVERQSKLEELAQAVSAQRTVSTIGEAWRLAHEGRADFLLVEEDFHYPARVDSSGAHLEPAENATASDVMPDAVDDLIEMVLDKGGRVGFVDNGALSQHGRIALIVRY